MIDMEIIKWGAGIAEGFELVGEGNQFPKLRHTGEKYHYYEMFIDGSCSMSAIIYPLFLQRVIEGINKTKKVQVIQRMDDIAVKFPRNYLELFAFNDNIDQSKEQAITYIYNQIRGGKH